MTSRRTFTPLASILSTFYGPGPAPDFVACGTCGIVMMSENPSVKVDDHTGGTYCPPCAEKAALVPLCSECEDDCCFSNALPFIPREDIEPDDDAMFAVASV